MSSPAPPARTIEVSAGRFTFDRYEPLTITNASGITGWQPGCDLKLSFLPKSASMTSVYLVSFMNVMKPVGTPQNAGWQVDRSQTKSIYAQFGVGNDKQPIELAAAKRPRFAPDKFLMQTGQGGDPKRPAFIIDPVAESIGVSDITGFKRGLSEWHTHALQMPDLDNPFEGSWLGGVRWGFQVLRNPNGFVSFTLLDPIRVSDQRLSGDQSALAAAKAWNDQASVPGDKHKLLPVDPPPRPPQWYRDIRVDDVRVSSRRNMASRCASRT